MTWQEPSLGYDSLASVVPPSDLWLLSLTGWNQVEASTQGGPGNSLGRGSPSGQRSRGRAEEWFSGESGCQAQTTGRLGTNCYYYHSFTASTTAAWKLKNTPFPFCVCVLPVCIFLYNTLKILSFPSGNIPSSRNKRLYPSVSRKRNRNAQRNIHLSHLFSDWNLMRDGFVYALVYSF